MYHLKAYNQFIEKVNTNDVFYSRQTLQNESIIENNKIVVFECKIVNFDKKVLDQTGIVTIRRICDNVEQNVYFALVHTEPGFNTLVK
jgi:hypothetical protein